jgi:hypothetical protein
MAFKIDLVTTEPMVLSFACTYAFLIFSSSVSQIIGRTLRKIPAQFGRVRIEDHPEHLLEALQEALSLVGPVKSYPALSSLS